MRNAEVSAMLDSFYTSAIQPPPNVRALKTSGRKANLLRPMAVVLLACGGLTARAQFPLDGFDPNANGTVRVVVVQPDGKILLGGDFTTLSPNGGSTTTRNHMARLN